MSKKRKAEAIWIPNQVEKTNSKWYTWSEESNESKKQRELEIKRRNKLALK